MDPSEKNAAWYGTTCGQSQLCSARSSAIMFLRTCKKTRRHTNCPYPNKNKLTSAWTLIWTIFLARIRPVGRWVTRWTTPLPPCPTTSMTCRSSSAMSKDAPPWPPLPSDVVAPSADAGRVASVASPSHSPPDSSSAPSSSSLDDVDRARAPISRDFPPRFVSSVGESSRTARLAPGGVDAPLSFAPVGVGAGAVGVPTPEMRRPFRSISKSPSRNAPDSVRSYGLASSVAVGSYMVTFLRLSGIDAMRTPPA